jgi:ATP-binding cassette subfamily B protein
MDGVRGDIVFDDVTFSYNDGRQVFSGLRLSVPAGRTVAIVGPSGAGKTTFCNLIPRFYEPQSGSIRIDGRDIRSFTLDSLRAQIGIVAQDVFLFTGTIRENIAYGRPGASDDEIIEAAVRAHAHSFIAELPAGYDTFIGEKGVKLSGGQKQRISIARVFLKNPRILIFDEATSSLDVKSEQVIQKAMAGLVKGRTAFIIAHRLSTIRHADEIVVLSERGIEQRGTHRSCLHQRDCTPRCTAPNSTGFCRSRGIKKRSRHVMPAPPSEFYFN